MDTASKAKVNNIHKNIAQLPVYVHILHLARYFISVFGGKWPPLNKVHHNKIS